MEVGADAWGRRLPDRGSAAVDPGWVETKLTSPGAPGHVDSSADSLSFLATDADLSRGLHWKGRSPIAVPGYVDDEEQQDRLAATCDRLAGL